MQMMCVKL